MAVVVGVFLFPKAPAQKKVVQSRGVAEEPLSARQLRTAGEGGIAQVSGQN